jgi:uncharacterized protein YwgA
VFDKYLVPLYVLYCNDGEIRGRTRFQKLVFLTKEKLKEEGQDIDIDFTCLYYGPFSRDLRDSLETQTKEGNVTEHVEESCFGLVYIYRLTDVGKDLVKDSLQKRLIPKEVRKKIKEVSKEFGNNSLDELISIVYKKYPEYNPDIH